MTDTSLHQLLTLAGISIDAGVKQIGFYCDPVPAIELRVPSYVPPRIANAGLHALASEVELASLPDADWLVYVAYEVNGGYVYLELFGGGTDAEQMRAITCLAGVIEQAATTTPGGRATSGGR